MPSLFTGMASLLLFQTFLMKTGIILVLLFAAISFSFAVKPSETNDLFNTNQGYKAIINFEDGFLAARTDGKIDFITDKGIVVRSLKIGTASLNCLITYNENTYIAGDSGSIVVYSKKTGFKTHNKISDKNINALVLFNDLVIAGSDKGEVLIGNINGDFKKYQLPIIGNIVSISSRSNECFGVTDEGEIISTIDGLNWKILDFNEYYKGFYKPCKFTCIFATEQQIAIAGKKIDGTPVLLLSNQGNVWSERSLDYTDSDGRISVLEVIPNCINYSVPDDLFILGCSKGKLMTIPSCSHCNKVFEYADFDISCFAIKNKTMIVAGINFYLKLIDTQFEK